MLSFQVLSLALTLFHFPLFEIFQSALSKCNVLLLFLLLLPYCSHDHHVSYIMFLSGFLHVSGPVSWYVDSFLLYFLAYSFYSNVIIMIQAPISCCHYNFLLPSLSVAYILFFQLAQNKINVLKIFLIVFPNTLKLLKVKIIAFNIHQCLTLCILIWPMWCWLRSNWGGNAEQTTDCE